MAQPAVFESAAPESSYIYFGVIPPLWIGACVDMATGTLVLNWGDVSPPDLIPAVRRWRREVWQRQTLKPVRRAVRD